MKITNTLLIMVILELGFIGWNQWRFAPISRADIRSAEDRRELINKIPLTAIWGEVDVNGRVDATITETVSVEVQNFYELER